MPILQYTFKFMPIFFRYYYIEKCGTCVYLRLLYFIIVKNRDAVFKRKNFLNSVFKNTLITTL